MALDRRVQLGQRPAQGQLLCHVSPPARVDRAPDPRHANTATVSRFSFLDALAGRAVCVCGGAGCGRADPYLEEETGQDGGEHKAHKDKGARQPQVANLAEPDPVEDEEQAGATECCQQQHGQDVSELKAVGRDQPEPQLGARQQPQVGRRAVKVVDGPPAVVDNGGNRRQLALEFQDLAKDLGQAVAARDLGGIAGGVGQRGRGEGTGMG